MLKPFKNILDGTPQSLSRAFVKRFGGSFGQFPQDAFALTEHLLDRIGISRTFKLTQMMMSPSSITGTRHFFHKRSKNFSIGPSFERQRGHHAKKPKAPNRFGSCRPLAPHRKLLGPSQRGHRGEPCSSPHRFRRHKCVCSGGQRRCLFGIVGSRALLVTLLWHCPSPRRFANKEPGGDLANRTFCGFASFDDALT